MTSGLSGDRPGTHPCTTTAWSKRHDALELQPDRREPQRPGMTGRTLCGTSGMDEQRANWERSRWGGRFRPLVLAALPECKQCAKARAVLARNLDAVGTARDPNQVRERLFAQLHALGVQLAASTVLTRLVPGEQIGPAEAWRWGLRGFDGRPLGIGSPHPAGLLVELDIDVVWDELGDLTVQPA